MTFDGNLAFHRKAEGGQGGTEGRRSRTLARVTTVKWPSERVHRLFVLQDGFAVVETVASFGVRRTVFDGDGSPKGNRHALWKACSLFSYLAEGKGADKGAVWKTARQALTGGEA